MPRYINDDAPVTPGIRQAARITADDLKQIMIRQYNASVSVKQCNAVFDENNYSDHNQAVTDLMAVLTCDEPKVSVDRSNIDFDIENLDASTPAVYTYAGDQGADLCGFHTLSSGLTFCGAIAGGDWEYPLFYIMYYDGTDLRAYIPIKGNVVNCDTLSAFGSEVNLCNPNAPYNLMQLYELYQQNGVLTPNTATLSEFVDDSAIATNSYLQQYGLTLHPSPAPGAAVPANAGGFNWDAIAEELTDAIQVI